MLQGNRTGSKVSACLVMLRTANKLPCRTCFTLLPAMQRLPLANWQTTVAGGLVLHYLPAAGLGFGRHTCQQTSLASLDRPFKVAEHPAGMSCAGLVP